MTAPQHQIDLTPEEARTLLNQWRTTEYDQTERITLLYDGRAWLALGYETWDSMCDTEIRPHQVKLEREERQAQVFQLRSKGMSTRQIGSALGVGKGTVDRDLATAPNGPVELPDTIVGNDGKQRAATTKHDEPDHVSPLLCGSGVGVWMKELRKKVDHMTCDEYSLSLFTPDERDSLRRLMNNTIRRLDKYEGSKQ